ncbi:MAG TPA: hypothetical protein VF704_07345 [Allosphingosinicella sp.]
MKTPFAVAAFLLLAGSACAQPYEDEFASAPIEWEIEPSSRAGHVQLEISRRSGGNHWVVSRPVEVASLAGLSPAQLDGSAGPIRFRMARDAGTLDCEGVARRGRGTGECSFHPDPRFAAALAERGISPPTPNEQFSMTMNGIGLDYVDELRRQRYDTPSATDLARAGDHGVTLDYLRAMGGHGYRVGRLAALVEMRDHGVTPDYIEGLARYRVRNIPPEEIVRLRDHGVTPEFVGELLQLGYPGLSTDAMIRLRDHGVTPEYVRTLASNGIRDIPPDELTRMRDHGVSPDFVTALRANGFGRFNTSEIVRMRDHGVDADYIAGLRAAGYTDISAEDIVRLRSHGVDTDFIRRANSGERFTPEELVRLRNGG